jgi:hypothetical protein
MFIDIPKPLRAIGFVGSPTLQNTGVQAWMENLRPLSVSDTVPCPPKVDCERLDKYHFQTGRMTDRSGLSAHYLVSQEDSLTLSQL